jgi:endonuclease YncB( thermonuclease family)
VASTTSPEAGLRRLHSLLRLLVLCCMALAGPLHAATFRGLVTHVTDGDTIWIRPAGESDTVELRLLDLDAPEGCQPYGAQAKKALAARILRQQVVVRTDGQDDYRRTLGRVSHKGKDVNAWMVREGHAWSMRFHGKGGRYERLERKARRAQKGLWSAPGAVDPRNFRRSHGRCQ